MDTNVTRLAETARARPGVLPDGVAFWGTGALNALFLLAASAPSPLYGTYAVRWHFSSSTLTVVFALYAFGLLAGLLVTGRLSDHVGRKPVVLGGIGLEIAGMVLFIVADSTAALAAARTVQGVATGVVIGVFAAQLVEFSGAVRPGLGPIINSAAPTFGLAIGAVTSSTLVQYGPHPLRLIYWIILAALIVGFTFVALIRETGEKRPGAVRSLVPVATIPRESRSTFVKILPGLIALWVLIGFYLSLAPSLIAAIEKSHNLLWGGFAIVCLCLTASIIVAVAKDMSAWTAMFLGCVGLFVGVGLTTLAIALGSGPLFLVTTVLAGLGFGLAFLGAIRAVIGVTPAERRAETLASLYIVSYAAFSIPIVIAGICETRFSSHDVALVFSGAVALVSAVGVVCSIPSLRSSRHPAV